MAAEGTKGRHTTQFHEKVVLHSSKVIDHDHPLFCSCLLTADGGTALACSQGFRLTSDRLKINHLHKTNRAYARPAGRLAASVHGPISYGIDRGNGLI